jgi:hypothetical protein
MKLKIWLDDQFDELEKRRPPDGWVGTKTAQETISLLQTNNVESISLDHDLGPEEAGNGYQVAKWIEQAAFEGTISRLKWHIHSANSVGEANMTSALKSADKFWDTHERLDVS